MTLNSSPSGPSAAAEIARRALEEVCSNRDDAGFDELYAENFVDHVNGTTYHGRDGARRSVAGIGACSATAIGSVSWSSSSTGTGFAPGSPSLAPTAAGRSSCGGLVTSRVVNGQIVEDWAATDTIQVLRQLGLWRSALLGITELRRAVRHDR
ncbi:MAG TPA: hypothetical protein VHR85_01875 [Nocardioides sp.]|nr:hypothetical protein [Nocardioides sp.]